MDPFPAYTLRSPVSFESILLTVSSLSKSGLFPLKFAWVALNIEPGRRFIPPSSPVGVGFAGFQAEAMLVGGAVAFQEEDKSRRAAGLCCEPGSGIRPKVDGHVEMNCCFLFFLDK